MASELGLSGKEAELYELLVSLGQGHLFEGWTKDEEKRGSFFAQMELLNKSYPGGLEAYVESAKSLLA
eukprot:CAMPEP_0118919752 /NCGR_PEP_ID=MMETSP1166-20130328/18720_1 /TAXON_ID=1104430 /ORGANISM="Chrysoreinhardia sp, Strain CCMP3193" /LENGTH=67 /DNA_ID=CAMNT_0006860283 /DNA_START=41 /DNA_END=241 /DNA_ORIENTATION=+